MTKAISVNDIIDHTQRAKTITTQKVRDIRSVTNMLRILALNALIEANRAGDKGAGFAVVADEVKTISTQVEALSGTLASELGGEIEKLEQLTQAMALQSQGSRLTDLALNAIELIDRNLYERTCDVRWWATDSAMVDAALEPDEARCQYASQRIGVILNAYTVYIDLWLCDLDGRIIANGRPNAYPIRNQSVANRLWFSRAKGLRSGDDFAVSDIAVEPLLGGNQVATYATGVREGGTADGHLLGVLGIHFDWQPQARAIVQGVRLSESERDRTRVLLVDATGLVIAASDNQGLLNERISIKTEGRDQGHYVDVNGTMTAFHTTPGYETYAGLGWKGVIIQKPA